MADVFLSYTRADVATARSVVSYLESSGISVWWDTTLLAGETWSESIRAELRGSKCVVVLWSKSSWQSRWVHAEAQYGFDRGCLVPARIDNVEIEPPFNVTQTADLRPENFEAGLASVLDGINNLSSRPQTGQAVANSNLANLAIPKSLRIVALGAILLTSAAWVVANAPKLFPLRTPLVTQQQATHESVALREESAAFALAKIDKISLMDWFNGDPKSLVDRVVENVFDLRDLRKAAGIDDRAQVLMGMAYEGGFGGVAQNDEEAAKYFQRAAASGNSFGKFYFARLQISGRETTRNLDAGLRLLHEASEQGNARASHSIGTMYVMGLYVEQDLEQARRYHQIAANEGMRASRDWLEQRRAQSEAR